MRAANTWIAPMAALLMILIGSLVPCATIIPQKDFSIKILELSSTWQIPALLIASMVLGARTGVISSTAYIIIGLFYLPVFHGGGSLGYLTIPEFGYLAGLIPAAWTTGNLATNIKGNQLIRLTIYSIIGLFIIHFSGIFYILLGKLLYKWPNELIELVITYTVRPLPTQLLLCSSIGLASLILRTLLIL